MERIVGIDIDGVITDETGGYERNIWHHYLCDYLGKEVNKKEDIYNIYHAYDIEKSVIDNFLKNNLENIYKDLIPLKGAQKVLKNLKNKKFDIILISAREEKYREVTSRWLSYYNIKYDKLVLSKDKVPYAKKEGIELFIEDDQSNAEDFKKNGIDVILFDKKHNRNTSIIEDEFRANNWHDAKEIIYEYFDLEK